jgi:hypothetical protein
MNNKNTLRVSEVEVALRGTDYTATGKTLTDAIRSLGSEIGLNPSRCSRLGTSKPSRVTIIDTNLKRSTATLYERWSDKRQRGFHSRSAWAGDVIGQVVIDTTYEETYEEEESDLEEPSTAN